MSKKMIDASTQAGWFSEVRKANQIEAEGEARLVDLSRRFGVSVATVNKVLARLKKEGYVNTQPYRALFLTEKGVKLAEKCKKRHEIILSFLLKLGVSRKNAEIDAEGIEHHVSEETLKKFEKFIKAKA
jgi:DtxR family manganese transport transcriptional regulator